jgi:hypothetical protein
LGASRGIPVLYIASVYQDPKASNRILGTIEDGGTFVYDWPKKEFTWTRTPEGPYDFIEETLKRSLRKLTMELVSGAASLSTEVPHQIDYFVHP